MEEFRRQFLHETVATLENLSNEFQSAESFSDSRKSEIFRTLHTVKGTSQTFGYQTSSRLAHHLETLFAKLKTQDFSANNEQKTLFIEGVEILIESLKQKNFTVPDYYADKMRVVPSNGVTDEVQNSLLDIPDVFLSQLAAQEKSTLRTALDNKKTLFCLEVKFTLASFAEQLISIREKLDLSGEIIATLPGAQSNVAEKIGFQILLASSTSRSELEEIARAYAAQIVFDSSQNDAFSNLPGVLSNLVKHGKTVAKALGKQIEFQVAGESVNLVSDKLKLVFDVLLHIIRNAVDHAFEKNGKVEITVKAESNNLNLIVSDNGRGIDLEKLRQKAVEKNLISTDQILSEKETIDLIFLPELSTKSEITEISGRGIGLDAVKSAVEKAGGQITVESEIEKGAKFQINLPLK